MFYVWLAAIINPYLLISLISSLSSLFCTKKGNWFYLKGNNYFKKHRKSTEDRKSLISVGKTRRRNWNAKTARGRRGWRSICLDMIMIVSLNISFKPLGAARHWCQWCQSVSVNSILILLGQHNNITSRIIASNHGTRQVQSIQHKGWRKTTVPISEILGHKDTQQRGLLWTRIICTGDKKL